MANPPSPSADIAILWRGSAGRRLKGLWTNLTWGKDGNKCFPYMNIFLYITNHSRQGAIMQHGKSIFRARGSFRGPLVLYYIRCRPSTRPKENLDNLYTKTYPLGIIRPLDPHWAPNSPLNLIGPLRSHGPPYKSSEYPSNVALDHIGHLRPPPGTL